MRLSLLPSEVLEVLLGLSSFIAQYAFAGPTVNVALQASFNAPPYILELLLVNLKIRKQLCMGGLTLLQGNSGRRKLYSIFPNPRPDC